MLGKLGLKGIVGVLALLGGVALIATADLRIAAGIGLVLLGLALTVWGLVSGLLESMGMGAMMGGGNDWN